MNGLIGTFDIICLADATGRTYIGRQGVRAPFHLSKPYWDGRVLLVNATNATAGVFAGDRLSTDVQVLEGARVLLTTPSAHRIHTMASGHAELEQVFRVAAGAWLEVMPELFIPQRGCRYHQRTRINVEPGGELFYVETLAPGRVARGEVFAFDEVSWDLDIRCGTRRIARERYTLRPGNASLWPLRAFGPATYYGAAYLVSDRADLSVECQDTIHALVSDGCRTGMTRLAATTWVVRVLAADSLRLKTALREIRRTLSPAWPHLAADARKL